MPLERDTGNVAGGISHTRLDSRLDISGELSSKSDEEIQIAVTSIASEHRPGSDHMVGGHASSFSGTMPWVDSLVCRICQSMESEPLLSPCQCHGTLAHVHRSCLEKWLTLSGRDYCELCGYRYRVVRQRVYNLCAGLRIWLTHGNVCCHLLLDVCMVLLSVIAVGLIVRTCLRVSRSSVNKPLLYLFSGLGVLAYFLIIHTLLKMHVVDWWRWWQSSVQIRLQLDE